MQQPRTETEIRLSGFPGDTGVIEIGEHAPQIIKSAAANQWDVSTVSIGSPEYRAAIDVTNGPGPRLLLPAGPFRHTGVSRSSLVLGSGMWFLNFNHTEIVLVLHGGMDMARLFPEINMTCQYNSNVEDFSAGVVTNFATHMGWEYRPMLFARIFQHAGWTRNMETHERVFKVLHNAFTIFLFCGAATLSNGLSTLLFIHQRLPDCVWYVPVDADTRKALIDIANARDDNLPMCAHWAESLGTVMRRYPDPVIEAPAQQRRQREDDD